MDEVLIAINGWLSADLGIIALPAAFCWGIVSVLLSPCHIASIPLFIAYVAGQGTIPSPRRAAGYAVLFAIGLFITIMVIGLACTLAGRMLGDVGPWWQVAVGLLLLWVAWTLFRPAQCSTTGSLMNRFKIRGGKGALFLGLGYGFLSGACTFGFIAPILGLITLQEEILTGVLMLFLFGIGHCLPLIVFGIFSSQTMKTIHSHFGLKLVKRMRQTAALIIAGLGIYFSVTPFVT